MLFSWVTLLYIPYTMVKGKAISILVLLKVAKLPLEII